MTSLPETWHGLPRDRLGDLVSAGAYGTVLVLAALSVLEVREVGLGYSAELVAGVGVATWVAHFFAESLAGHIRHWHPLQVSEVRRLAVDETPVLASTVLPAAALLFGRFGVMSEGAARSTSIVVAVLQLLAIGIFVGHVSPTLRWEAWLFAGTTALVGVLVVALTVVLGH